MSVEREDRKSKDCALVASMLKAPRDEEEQGKETERERPVGRGEKVCGPGTRWKIARRCEWASATRAAAE